MQFTAVGWDLYHRTGKAISLGWAGLVQAAPVMLLAIPAGQIADLFSRRAIVIAGQTGLAVCSVALAVISHYQHSVGWMYGVLGVGAICSATAGPARSALLASTVPSEHYSNAVTWNSNFFQSAAMIGPAIAGFILIHSTSAVYLVDSISSIVCVGLLARLSASTAAPRTGGASLQTLLAGVRFVRDTPIILATITLDLFAVLLGGATYLLPIYATAILHVGPAGFGWMRAAPAVGAVVMGVTIAHLPPLKKAGRDLLLAVSGFGIATIIFGLSHWFWLSLLMLFLTGALDNVSVVVRHTLVQVLTPDAMRGRVSAVNNVFIGASNELGGLESGMTAAWLGPFWSVVGGGIGTLLVVAATAAIWPQMRRFGSLGEAKPAEPAPGI
jgi:MFS family permease